MRLMGPAAFCFLGVVLAACATGTATDDTVQIDSGTKTDSSIPKDSGPVKDGAPPKDTGGPPLDSGSNNCGGQCLGLASTCCNNVCVDITSDPNNCGGCGNTPCGTSSCCARQLRRHDGQRQRQLRRLRHPVQRHLHERHVSDEQQHLHD